MPKESPSDMLNDSLKECVFKRKNGKAFKKLVKETNFNAREVEGESINRNHWVFINFNVARYFYIFFFPRSSFPDTLENIKRIRNNS